MDNIQEVHVSLRRGGQKVTMFRGVHGEAVTWRDGAWVPGVEASEEDKAALRSLGSWLTRTVGKADHADESSE